MSFSSLINQRNKYLIPFSWLYKFGVWVYHRLYDWGIKKSYKPSIPTICVGNLSVGGTGKSPMVEYLVSLLAAHYKVAIISRGYRRKTKGLIIANAHTTANDIGDEPMQFRTKYPKATVAVSEERVVAIEHLCELKLPPDVILLDDAFQHRSVTAGLNILLTEYQNIFSRDEYLPAGSLRDLKSNYKRAHIIVVTKADKDLSEFEKQNTLKKIKPLPHQKVFFTTIHYGEIYNIFSQAIRKLDDVDEIVLVTGIANPRPMLSYLKKNHAVVQHLKYPDHHDFSKKDIGDILGTYCMSDIENKIILTTEKDAMRLRNWQQIAELPVFALSVTHRFLFEEGSKFDDLIVDYTKLR